MEKKLQRREEIAEKLDAAIEQVAGLYRRLTELNASIPGRRGFDRAETDRRLIDRLTYALSDPVTHQGPLGTGRPIGKIMIAESVRKDHAELAARKGA